MVGMVMDLKPSTRDRLNPQSHIPLYRQLADRLAMGIRRGDYPVESKIPSENKLADTYGIGRPTVRQATDFLVRKKMLIRKRGAGTFVCNSHEVDLFSIGGTLSAFHRKGISIETVVLQGIDEIVVPASPENPFGGDRAYFFSRLVCANEAPILIEDMYLHPIHFKGIEKINPIGKSISQIADELFYMKPSGGKQNFKVSYLNDKRSTVLNINKKTPVLEVKRFLDFPQAKDAVYVEIFCKTDKFVFSQILMND
jgi:GntR family transcriptional regulator